MTMQVISAAEAGEDIATRAAELSKLADAVGADRLSTLLAQVAEQAHELSRRPRPHAAVPAMPPTF